jgi:PBSX family phage terminase large subunit
MEDNPSLSPEILARYKSLYSGHFYDRFVLGKWVAAQGLVYAGFDVDKDIASPPDKDAERYYISCDYGTVNPSSFGLWGLYDGVWYRIREDYYNSRKVGSQRTDEEHYAALCELAQGLKISAVIVDPSAASFIECIRRHGRFHVMPAKNNVVDGIRRVSDALRSGEIKIAPCCKDAIREFGLYRWDDNLSKDAPRKENDHAMDDIRYFVMGVIDKAECDFFALALER